MAASDAGIDGKYILGTALAALAVWLAYQQLEINKLQLAEQRRAQSDQELREKEQKDRTDLDSLERTWPKYEVTRKGGVVHVLIRSTDPITKGETVTDLETNEEGWRSLENDIKQTRFEQRQAFLKDKKK